jgi:hypothetical protein
MKNADERWFARLPVAVAFLAAEQRGPDSLRQLRVILTAAAQLRRPQPFPQMPRFRFENFTTANGLPTITCSPCWWMATASGRARTTAWGLRESAWKTYTTRTAWRIAPCFRWRWTSAPAMCGPAPWAG